MGSFSCEFADRSAKQKNLTFDKPFKFLIPEHLGGGFIKDKGYQDYGNIGEDENGNPLYDWYELIPIMNKNVKLADIVAKINKKISLASKDELVDKCENLIEKINALSEKDGKDIEESDLRNLYNEYANVYRRLGMGIRPDFKEPPRCPTGNTVADKYKKVYLTAMKTNACHCRNHAYYRILGFGCDKAFMYKAEIADNPDITIGDLLEGDLTFPKKIDEATDLNRSIGIDLACCDALHELLPYPLKIVHARCKDTYESCKDFSRCDGEQGYHATYFTKEEMENAKNGQ